MAERTRARSFAPWIVAFVVIWIVGRLGYLAYTQYIADDRYVGETRVTVSELSETLLQPLDVEPPEEERWRDIAGAPYDHGVRARFTYSDTDRHRAEVDYESEAPTLRGTISTMGLKPSFAYQVKLVGLRPISGTTEAENAHDPLTLSSWRLGTIGRWWCEDCDWNLLDRELADHIDEGHEIFGYLLFDWFVTDERGDAGHRFALDSSLHVLWRVDQRERGRRDSAPRWYTVERPPRFYPPGFANTVEEVGLYAEWAPDRPLIGEARLAPGAYHVGMNLTEESFHDNMDEERMLPGGGFWARVLQAELQFEVSAVERVAEGG